MSRFIALHCGDELAALLADYPNAFLLLTQIAMRAKWKDCPITGLKCGEAFIGDWKNAGLRSPKAYEVAKKRLEKSNLARFQGGNRGTRASLVDTTIFSLSTPNRGGLEGKPKGSKGGAEGDQGGSNHTDTQNTPTTQNKDFVQTDELNARMLSIVQTYPRRENENLALDHLLKSIRKGEDPEVIMNGTRAIAAVMKQIPSGPNNGFLVSAANFFKYERWRDDPQTWLRSGTGKNGAQPQPLNLGGRQVGSVTKMVNGVPTKVIG